MKKSNKNKKMLKQFKPLLNRDNMGERSRKKIDEIERLEELQREQGTMAYKKMFSKDRIICYLSLLFLPPYGLYRIWYKKSTFSMVEKYLWTFVSAMSLVKFMELIA